MLLSVLLLAAISGCDARRIGLNDDDDDDDDENKIPKPLVTTSILSSDDGAAEILGLDKVREMIMQSHHVQNPVVPRRACHPTILRSLCALYISCCARARIFALETI